MKHLILVLIAFLIARSACSQQQAMPHRWAFQTMLNVGVLEAQDGSALQLQSVNGLAYRSWFAGIGVGLDEYRLRSIPLFMDFRKEFGPGMNKLFLYADLGIHMSWLTDKQKMDNYGYEHPGHGFYDDFGFGYKARVGKRNAFLFSAGYSNKIMTMSSLPGIYPDPIYTDTQTDRIRYAFNRISLKVGWIF